jgi:hypothetical protein
MRVAIKIATSKKLRFIVGMDGMAMNKDTVEFWLTTTLSRSHTEVSPAQNYVARCITLIFVNKHLHS